MDEDSSNITKNEVHNNSNSQKSDNNKDSILDTLIGEWSLLWQSISEDSDEEQNLNPTKNKLEVLGLDKIKEISRTLSQERKKINQSLERLHKEIDLNHAKLESLRLVGSEESNTLARLNELSDQGQNLSHRLELLDRQLRTLREQEKIAKSSFS